MYIYIYTYRARRKRRKGRKKKDGKHFSAIPMCQARENEVHVEVPARLRLVASTEDRAALIISERRSNK